jgi:hypothetical protein
MGVVTQDGTCESSELRYGMPVSDDRQPEGKCPLVVFDDYGGLRYGLEFLTAMREAVMMAPACVVRSVRFERYVRFPFQPTRGKRWEL